MLPNNFQILNRPNWFPFYNERLPVAEGNPPVPEDDDQASVATDVNDRFNVPPMIEVGDDDIEFEAPGIVDDDQYILSDPETEDEVQAEPVNAVPVPKKPSKSYLKNAPFSRFPNKELRNYFCKDFINTVIQSPEYPPILDEFTPSLVPSTFTAPFFDMTKRKFNSAISRGKHNWTVYYTKWGHQQYRSTARVIDLKKLVKETLAERPDLDYYKAIRKLFSGLTIDTYISHYLRCSFFQKAYKTNKIDNERYVTLFERQIPLEELLSTIHHAKPPHLISENVMYYILWKSLKAISVLHSLGISHNDINAGTIFIKNGGRIILGDFIFASHIGEKTAERQKKATAFNAYVTDVMGLVDVMARMMAPDYVKKLKSSSKPRAILHFKTDIKEFVKHTINMHYCISKKYGTHHDYTNLCQRFRNELGQNEDKNLASDLHELLGGRNVKEGWMEFYALLNTYKLMPKKFIGKNGIAARIKPTAILIANLPNPGYHGQDRINTLDAHLRATFTIEIHPEGNNVAAIEEPQFGEPEFSFDANFKREYEILNLLQNYVYRKNRAIPNAIDRYYCLPWHLLKIRRVFYEYFVQVSLPDILSNEAAFNVDLAPERGLSIRVKMIEHTRRGKDVGELFYRMGNLDMPTPADHVLEIDQGVPPNNLQELIFLEEHLD
uniref:Protein kinase domain-containing protein n=1 Tax=Panagrellus redivivus TaxID=6233 RepID=A0A7E4ZZ22_PANRE